MLVSVVQNQRALSLHTDSKAQLKSRDLCQGPSSRRLN